MKPLKLIAATAICLSAITAFAGTAEKSTGLPAKHKLIFIGNSAEEKTTEAYDSLINIFYEDQFRHAQDPQAPYFLLMSRDSKIAMGVGGKVQGNLSYDFDGSISGSDFTPYTIPVPRDPANVTRFQAGMNQSSLLFTIFGDSRFGHYIVNVQGEFSGPSSTFKLKKAYITVGHITLGKAKSSFSDPAAMPSTVETEGPAGAIDDNAILLRYAYTFSKKYTVAASIETPSNDYDVYDGVTEATSDCAPKLAAYVQYGGNSDHVRLAGMVKTMRYRNLLAGKNHRETGYGVSLTAVGNLSSPLTFYGGINYGKGIGNMLNNLSCGNNDMLSYSSAAGNDYGKMYAPETLGWFAALQYNFSPSVFSTVVFSQDRIYTKDHTAYTGDGYRYGLYAVANVFWNVTPRVQIGGEFDWGRRVDINGEGSNAHRFALMGAFSF